MSEVQQRAQPTPRTQRTQRSDAARNRGVLLAAATRVFASAVEEPSMREVARQAGVGVATLYRHFPSREALVDAVYADQVERLVLGADDLLARLPPFDALRAWMDLFADWMATKHGMTGTLLAMIDSGTISLAQTRATLVGALERILEAGRAAGDVRLGVGADDITTGLIGIVTAAGAPQQNPQATVLLDVFCDGLRSRAG